MTVSKITSPVTPLEEINKINEIIDNLGGGGGGGSIILEALYPVGSIYITTANSCPLSTLISGSTWTLVSSGRVLQGADNDHSAGTTIEAGLPNIKGTTGMSTTSQSGGTPTGAFYKDSNIAIWGWSNGGSNPTAYSFDASLSNPIYGNSTTVQPPAYCVNIYRRTA